MQRSEPWIWFPLECVVSERKSCCFPHACAHANVDFTGSFVCKTSFEIPLHEWIWFCTRIRLATAAVCDWPICAVLCEWTCASIVAFVSPPWKLNCDAECFAFFELSVINLFRALLKTLACVVSFQMFCSCCLAKDQAQKFQRNQQFFTSSGKAECGLLARLQLAIFLRCCGRRPVMMSVAGDCYQMLRIEHLSWMLRCIEVLSFHLRVCIKSTGAWQETQCADSDLLPQKPDRQRVQCKHWYMTLTSTELSCTLFRERPRLAPLSRRQAR